jgi:dTDP-4-amino-4,6-dideoxygalactose transaminase
MAQVDLLDLTRQFDEIGSAVRARLEDVLTSQRFILGPVVQELEEGIASYLDVPYAVGVASGTDALLLPLRALEMVAGDEVVTSPFTFFATAGAIHNAGGRPVFADIDPVTFNLDPAWLDEVVTERTRAIVPVHLFGQMTAMEPVLAVAREHGAFVLEDAAQAIGARQCAGGEWMHTGRFGDASALSFFPSKNLGGYGDGGMVVTRDREVADRLRRLRVHGGTKMYHHEEVGFNSRLDALQAAVLLAKLPFLDGWSRTRRGHAAWYDARFQALEDTGAVTRPRVAVGNEAVYNQYTLRVAERDRLRDHLTDQGVGSAVYYPVPLHLQPCFRYLGYAEGDFPEAERAAREVISIPVYPELRDDERERVATAIEGFYAGGA